MDTNRWEKIEEIFNAALALTADEREQFLDAACAGQPELRAEVDSLVIETQNEGDFLSQPAFALGARLLSADAFELVAGQTFGSYKIIRPLGRGGMGDVFLAEDLRLQRLVALKLLPVTLTGNAGSLQPELRFQQEARAASAISHPNVAHIYEFGHVEDRNYLAMEFVGGQTLRSLLKERHMNLARALDIAQQVAQALQAAHEAGVVHRDIKPENIMVRRDGYVKVLDFGLAKLTSSKTQAGEYSSNREASLDTTPGLIMGTTGYMSPEQVRGDAVDPRTDIWSWGVVLYEMLAGQAPFIGATRSDIIAEILKAEPPLTATDSVALPRDLQLLLCTALRKNPEERYASIADAIKSLRDIGLGVEHAEISGLALPLTGEAPRITNATQETIGQTARRKLPLMVGAGVLLLTVVVLMVYTILVKQRKDRSVSPARITHLTNDGHVMDAAISPDARLLAFAPIESGKQSLRIRNLESGESWQLLSPDPALCWGLRFTPNSESIFYITTQPGSTISVLYRMPVRGGPSQKVIVNIDSPPGLSPDGMQIAFIRSYPGQHRDALIIANIDGSAEREILARPHPDKFSFSGVSWSPDGKLIAVGVSRGNETELAILGIPTSGGAPVELTPWQWTAVRGVVWRNDSRTLLFCAMARGQSALQVWELRPGGEIKPVTNDEKEYEELTIADDGQHLVATDTYEVSDLWLTSPAGDPRRIGSVGHDGADGLAVTSAGRIVCSVGENEQSQLWSLNSDGSDRKQLTTNSGFLPSVSRDGQLVAYVSTDGGAHHIWLTDINGQNNRQLTHGEGESYPSITPDGDAVVYTARAKDRGTLWKIPTTGGQPVQLTYSGIIVKPVISPDGTRIACTYRTDEADRWKTAVLSFDGGQPLKTFALPYPYNQIIRWSPDGQALTYIDKVNGVHNLWRQPLDGSAPTRITNFAEDLILHYGWLASGQELIVSRGGRRRDIVLIKISE